MIDIAIISKIKKSSHMGRFVAGSFLRNHCGYLSSYQECIWLHAVPKCYSGHYIESGEKCSSSNPFCLDSGRGSPRRGDDYSQHEHACH